MGRKHSSISGLSRFVSDVFGSSESQNLEHKETPATSDNAVSSAAAANTGQTAKLARRASERGEEGEPQDPESRSVKKRKTGLLGPGLEKYDATELVPFYTHPSQVPAHLQKCTFLGITFGKQLLKTMHIVTQIIISGRDISLSTRLAVCLTKRVGTA